MRFCNDRLDVRAIALFFVFFVREIEGVGKRNVRRVMDVSERPADCPSTSLSLNKLRDGVMLDLRT
jgi:hypothetical protein